MKKLTRQTGLVLKSRDFSEQAKIVDVLTKEGIKSYIVKGAKNLSGGTRLLTNEMTLICFNATLSDGLATLTEGEIVNSYLDLKTNMNKIYCLYVILEKILAFSANVVGNEVFYNFVIQTLDLLSKFNEHLILTIFELKLTYLIGIGPEMRHCVVCENKTDVFYFSSKNGGIVCENCKMIAAYDLDANDAKMLRLLYLVKMDKIDENLSKMAESFLANISKIIDVYYSEHLDFKSRAKQVLKDVV